MSYLINNFDFEWFGRVVFSVIEIGLIFAVMVGLMNFALKKVKKLLRIILKFSEQKAAEANRREREKKEMEYISVLSNPDYYGD